MSQRFQNHGPRFNYTAGIGLGLVLLAIVLGLAASRGVVPVPSFSLVGEPTRTPTAGPSRTATRTPHAEATTVASATRTRTAVVLSTATGVPSDTATPGQSPTQFASGTATNIVVAGTATKTPSPSPTTPATATPILSPSPTGIAATGPTWYVSKSGSNADGRSWASAWSELASINWAVVRPGDTVLVASGTYTTSLVPTTSGTASAPITVMAQGQVTIFGGRSTPLPYCYQTPYTYQTAGVRQRGMDFSGVSYITVDGGTWRGIKIYGHNLNGIGLGSTSSHITIRNVEVYDNGNAFLETRTGNSHYGTWYSDQPNIALGGTNNTVDRAVLRDAGQDAFQSTSGAVTNFTLSNSWLTNTRPHPAGSDIAANYCRHSDGIQIWNTGIHNGLTITGSVIGPGFLQGTLLGQTGATQAQVNNVTIRDTLFIGSANANVSGYASSNSQGWLLDRVTSLVIPSHNHAVLGGFDKFVQLDGGGHRITNSVAYEGRVETPGGTVSSGNCSYNLITGSLGGVTANPQFRSPPASNSLADLTAADYTVTNPACAGKGSSITSVAQLLAQ